MPQHSFTRGGSVCSIWLCANFQYVDIEGKDGITVEISRKVQATKSIWEEMNDVVQDIMQGKASYTPINDPDDITSDIIDQPISQEEIIESIKLLKKAPLEKVQLLKSGE